MAVAARPSPGSFCLQRVPFFRFFAWRLLRDRLLTKSDLASRGTIHAENQPCVFGCGQVESGQHLFLNCGTFNSLGSLVRHWISFAGVDSHVLSYHFIQFIHATGGLKVRHSFLQLIWLLCVWVVWNECNYRLFKNLECSIPHLLDKFKYYSLSWLQANFVYGSQYCVWLSILVVEPLFLFGHRLIFVYL